MRLFYDLHIHSCLSPCAADDMTPANLCNMAALAGLQVIAAADHNSCLNCSAVCRAAENAGIFALPAMELTTEEEVHVLCLLPDCASALAFSGYVRQRLPDRANVPDIFGRQTIMDAYDREIGEEERLLSAATSIGIYEAARLLRQYGGIALPAHIDRPSFSLLGNLGVYDPTMGFSVFETTRECDVPALLHAQPALAGLGRISNSDAHDLFAIRDAENALEAQRADAPAVIAALYAMGAQLGGERP